MLLIIIVQVVSGAISIAGDLLGWYGIFTRPRQLEFSETGRSS